MAVHSDATRQAAFTAVRRLLIPAVRDDGVRRLATAVLDVAPAVDLDQMRALVVRLRFLAASSPSHRGELAALADELEHLCATTRPPVEPGA